MSDRRMCPLCTRFSGGIKVSSRQASRQAMANGHQLLDAGRVQKHATTFKKSRYRQSAYHTKDPAMRANGV